MYRDTQELLFFTILVIALLGGYALTLGFGGCDVDEQTAIEVLQDEGYTDIEIGGHAYFSCGEDDALASEFTAKRGERVVEGSICCGFWIKDCTVRH